MAHRARPLVLVGAVVLAACGGADQTVAPASAPPAPTTDPIGSEPPNTTAPASAPTVTEPGRDAAVTLERCASIPLLMTEVESAGRAVTDTVAEAVWSIWEPEGPESAFAGVWSVPPDGPLVVAVTGDAEAHRASIAERSGGSNGGFDVVEVEFSHRTLIDAAGATLAAASNAGIEALGAAVDVRRNRVRLEAIAPIDDADLMRLAEAVEASGVAPTRLVCVQAPAVAAPVIEPGTPLEVIVLPDATGALPSDTLLTCSAARRFRYGDLVAPKPLTSVEHPAALASFEAWLANAHGQTWPQDGWLLLHSGPDEVVLLHPEGEMGLAQFERHEDHWFFSGVVSGAVCIAELALPEGMNPVDWTLDPDAPPPGLDSIEIQVLVTERSCAGGAQVGDRLLGPEVVETEHEVLIAFAAIAQLGAQTCPSHPPTAVTVVLAEPLGERRLRGGLDVGPITNLVEPLG